MQKFRGTAYIPLRGRILRSRLGRFNRPGRRLCGVAEAGGVYAEARDLILIRVVIKVQGKLLESVSTRTVSLS